MKITLLINLFLLPLLLLSSSICTSTTADSPPSRPFNELSLYLDPPPLFYLPYIPDTGEYYITNELSPIDVRRLLYSKKDWQRFDSYTPSVSLYVKPTDWIESTRINNVNTEYINIWLNVFSHVIDVDFYQIGYGWFRAFSKSSFDIYANLLQSNDFNVGNCMNNVSYSINQAINVWRNKEKLAGSNLDTISLPDVKTMNTVPETLVWLERFITSELNVQSLTHNMVPRPGSPWPPYDEFGLFANQQSLGVGYSPSAHVFQVTPLGVILSHYVHLFTPSFLRKSRRSIMASYSALYFALTTQGGDGAQLSTAQWLDRVAGASLHVNYMLQTEKYLKASNGWVESIDGVSAINIAEGKWTNEGALEFLNKLMDTLVTRTYSYGFTEYNSVYYANDMDSFTIALLHSPNQIIYDKWESVYKWFWWDIAANYHPGSGVLTGAIARTYDPYSGAHGGVDRQTIRMYVLPFFRSYCRYTDSISNVVHDACHSSAVGAQPPSGDFAMSPQQFMWAAWNAGGYGYIPMDVIVNMTILMPYRTVEQRFDSVRGQERYNFIAPGYSIAHSGEQTGFTTVNVIATARIAGEPNRAFPISPSKQQTHSVNFVRLMLENTDAPFGSAGSGPGINVQLIPRQICSQYQSFLLITSLSMPGKREYFMPDDDGTSSLNTDLLLPLHVDGLFADDIALPRTIGASMILSHNAVLTVRHGSQTLAFRLLYSERSSTSSIIESTTTTPYTGDAARIQPRAASLPYSYMWIVDAEGWAQGNGRIVICHKHGNGADINAKGPFRVSWLWGAGETNTDAEVNALRSVMREAKLTNTITETPLAARTVDLIGNKLPSTFWNTSVTIDSSLVLNVERTDTFQSWGNDPIWAKQGGSNLYPIFTLPFSRRVNGSEILNFKSGEFAFRVRNDTNNVYQPHRDWLKRKTQTTTPATTTPIIPTIITVDPSAPNPVAPNDFTSLTKVTPSTTSSNTATAPTTGITIPTSFILPTRIECELFSGWYDTSNGNLGRGTVPNRGLYSSAPVDISYSTLASYGYYVSYIHDQEWLEYPISSLITSKYSISVRYAQAYQTVKAVTILVDNVVVCTIPTVWTQGWEIFKIGTCITPTPITAGLHTFRLLFPSRELNVDFTQWSQVSASTSTSTTGLPATGAAIIDPTYDAIRANIHLNYPINQTQSDEFIKKFTNEMALALGLTGTNIANRILIVDIDSDGSKDMTDEEENQNETGTETETGSGTNEVESTGSNQEQTTSTDTDTLNTGSTSDNDVASTVADIPSDGSASTGVEDTSASESASPPSDPSSAATPSRRRLLQLSGYFDVITPPLGSGVNVAFIVLPSDLTSTSSETSNDLTPDTNTNTMSASESELLALSAALSSSCTEPVLSLWQNVGPILSSYDCLNSPTIESIKVKRCPDESIAEICPSRSAISGDSGLETLAPPPNTNKNDPSFPAAASTNSSDPLSISTRTLILILVGTFLCCAIVVLISYKLRQWWLNKGKIKFESSRRRTSFDAASSELQLQGMNKELVGYRNKYPAPPTQGTRREMI